MSGLGAKCCLAASTILSTGFEPPSFAPGTLQGQPPGGPNTWVTAGTGGSSATVENSIVHSGSQAVQVVKAANSDRRWAVPVSGYPTQQGFVVVDWDMRVTQASVATGFGPFFGVETYDADISPFVLGALGVDATTGDVLFENEDNGVLTETGSFASFNEWYHYRLVMDFNTDRFRAYFNGVQVADKGFVDRGSNLDNFTDADIATLAAGGDLDSQTKSASAVFDNFVVRDGLMGDYDIDGDVDNADYTQWRTTFGNSVAAGKFADGSSNGIVDAADYVIWRDNRGTNVFPGAGVGSGGAVPEPTSLLMLLVALPFMILLDARRRTVVLTRQQA